MGFPWTTAVRPSNYGRSPEPWDGRPRPCFTLHRVVGLVRRVLVGVVVMSVRAVEAGRTVTRLPHRERRRCRGPRSAAVSPDTPARAMRFRNSDDVALDGAVVGSGPVGAVLVHETPGFLPSTTARLGGVGRR